MDILLYVTILGPFVCALLGYLIGRTNKTVRDYFVVLMTGLTLALVAGIVWKTLLGMQKEIVRIPGVMGMGLTFQSDPFRALYCLIAGFMWFVSAICSRDYFAHYRNRNRYYFFYLCTLGATLGVLFSADLFTTFLFFEIMSFTSYVWVAQDERAESLRAAGTYLAVAVIGGLVMLMGIFLVYSEAGAGVGEPGTVLTYEKLRGLFAAADAAGKQRLTIAGICMLFGFGAKAGMFPLHIWLPKAHPQAPAPASALLSGILTKTGVFGILMLSANLFTEQVFWGKLILLLGVMTMVLGAILALLSIDLKRTLACSSVSQIGFILVGIGMAGLLGKEALVAVRGSMLHMVNHSLIKLVLFLCAGIVYQNIHKLDLNEIRGFGRKKPVLLLLFLAGALTIAGMPLFSGYVSKTLIHESIVEYMHLCEENIITPAFSMGTLSAVEWLFLISGGFTVAYMIKLFVALFLEKNTDEKEQKRFEDMGKNYIKPLPAVTLGTAALSLLVFGCFPEQTFARLADNLQYPFEEGAAHAAVAWFSPENLKGAAISISIGLFLYFAVVRTLLMQGEKKVYVNRLRPWMDLENMLYRPILLYALPFVGCFVCRVLDSLVDGIVVFLRKTIYKDSPLPGELAEGTRLTNALGRLANWYRDLCNHLRRRTGKTENTVDYKHCFAINYEEWHEDVTIVTRSLSFGLLLFCVGLMITVIYLLVR